MKKLVIACLMVFAILVSCKKEKDNKSSTSRTLRYEITGNFTGTFHISYYNASGGIANEQVTLPWNKEITYANNVTAVTVALTGNQGVAGQKVVLVVKRGGTPIGTPFEVVAKASGSFSEAPPAIVL